MSLNRTITCNNTGFQEMLQNVNTIHTQPGHPILALSLPTEFYIIQTAQLLKTPN